MTDKITSRWFSHRLHTDVDIARFGHFGQPLLLFPTAGGDFEECERFLMIRALQPLLDAGRLKIYSCDSVAGRAWLNPALSGAERSRIQNAFDAFIVHEFVPAIRQDCNSPDIEIWTSGASLGAFNALAALTRHPDIFSKAICMSGTYDMEKKLQGHPVTQDFYFSSPLHFLPNLTDGPILDRLRERFLLILCALGRWEDPEESRRVSHVLTAKAVPHRLEFWGSEWDHDWPTWRKQLPFYLDKMLP